MPDSNSWQHLSFISTTSNIRYCTDSHDSSLSILLGQEVNCSFNLRTTFLPDTSWCSSVGHWESYTAFDFTRDDFDSFLTQPQPVCITLFTSLTNYICIRLELISNRTPLWSTLLVTQVFKCFRQISFSLWNANHFADFQKVLYLATWHMTCSINCFCRKLTLLRVSI